MKQYIYLILTLGAFFLNSCTDESWENGNANVEEGIPVEVSLSFTQEEAAKVTSKAALSEEDENKVYDIRVFIFDKEKKLEYTSLLSYENGNTDKSGTVKIPRGEVTTGQKYIYAIANTENGAGSFSSDNLANIKTVGDLKNLYSTLSEKTDQRLGGRLLMSGAYKGNGDKEVEEASCVITKELDTKSLPGTINLSHVDSRITFKVGVAKGSNITFVPRTWHVVNVPQQSFVFGSDSDYATKYFNTEPKSFDNSTIDDTKYKGGVFSFYMYENRKEAKRNITDYQDRERQKEQSGPNGDFLYADPQATYVVLTGDYSDGEKTTASVRYTIHLGYVNDVASDFKSLRNTIYTYNVTVAGVENIILEVESSQPGEEFKEKQPGAEGSVVVAEQSLSVDAHYEARNVTFRKNDLSNLSVLISTPFNSNGKFSIDAEGVGIPDNFVDYKWVKFVKTASGLAEYPGDTESVSTVNGIPTNDDGKHYLTIDQVLKQLYDKNKNPGDYWNGKDENRSVTYTAFIDEFYYTDRNWKEFVNVDDRKMHILCNTQFSSDKQSDLTTANIMISQRSIKTIYNKNATDYETAWGVETVDETKGMPMSYKVGAAARTGNNGRYTTYEMIKNALNNIDKNNVLLNKEWDNYIEVTSDVKSNKLKDRYHYAEFACLQRNRDLNGNKKIDADEIRWYLPSTTQYTGLWLGKDALYPEARLFQKDPALITNGTQNGGDGSGNDNFASNNHFVSSNSVRFWAEEGAATGSNNDNVVEMNRTKFNFRCARNLGARGQISYDEPKISDKVDDYVIPELNKQGFVTKMDLTRLDAFALRSTKEQNIEDHKEHSGADFNRPYKKFEVVEARNNKCPAGYRIPNQRELALIAGYSTTGMNATRSCTKSDLTYKKGLYYIAISDGTINKVTIYQGASTAITRCVRDID